MLGSLKTFFSKKKEVTAPESELYHPEPNTNPNFLTDSKKILSLLKNIEGASPLCTVIVEGIDEQFSSSILDVKLDDNLIILDELLPSHGNKFLNDKNKIKFSTLYNGISLSFTLNNIESGSSRGIAYYKATIPDRIYYPQRRKSPRIQITTLNIPFSGISERTKATVGGTLFDISREGLSLGISISNNIARLHRGDTLKNCRITFEDQSISFDLAIRFVKTSNKNTGRTLIGGCFENLSAKNKHIIERIATTLEREEIRNRKQ